MDTITVNGHDLAIDLMEADNLEKFENAMNETSRKVDDKQAQEGMSHADMYRYQCKCVDEFFDKVFGPGTAEMIFGPNNTNIRDHVDAFGKAALMPSQSGTDIGEIMDKYTEQADKINSSGMNRAQRRAQAKRDRRAARNAQQTKAQEETPVEFQDDTVADPAVLEIPLKLVEDNKEADDTQEQLDAFVEGLTDAQRKKLAEKLTSDTV